LAADAPAKWSDTIKFGLQIEGGITGNTSSPKDNLNFGHSFTDRANEPVMNQALATVGRALDPKATDYDFGFKLQGMYGTDARYTHFARLWDKTTKGRYQFDIVEASVSLHTPWLTEGGIDYQLGLWPTPLGAETIDPSTNSFYSHSYIFNFGLPFKHSGVNATIHVNDMIDIYGAVTAGTNTIAGFDNNGSAGFIVGGKLTFLEGNLTVLALSHNGPENASRAVPSAGKYNRSYNDIVVTWKATDKLTFISELNYVREDFARAEAFGFAQYVGYALTETVTLNARAEVFRDTRGFFVAGFPTAQGPVLALEGYAVPSVSYGKTTYGALTLGATWKPALPESLGADTSLMIRPELRVDTVLDGGKRFNAGRDKSAVTLGSDFILAF
jgi:hypothetical protein